MLPINRNPGARELRAFARIWFPLFVAVLGGLTWWRGGSPLAVGLVWGVGGALAALALASREAARIIFVGLMTVTYPIGLVVSTLALGIHVLPGVHAARLGHAARRDAIRCA